MTAYEAGAHEAQMAIMRALLFADECSFGELRRAADLTGDHVTFHIKQLVQNGYVERVPMTHGKYCLTRAGKEYANRMDTDEAVMEKQPKLSVVVVIEDAAGNHLQQQRLKQPYYGYWGHLTGKIRWGETMLEAAARELKEEAGLEADLRVVGFYHKLDRDEETNALLEDKYFCLIHGVNPRGELIVDSDGHHNEWMSSEEFQKKEKQFGSVIETIAMVRQPGFVVKEQTYHYQSSDY
jgi:ADP-ribose pyrophosphatase YjhB (NUDIX family)